MKLTPRSVLPALAAAGLLIALALLSTPERTPLAAAPGGVSPLDRVPADAGLVVHFRAGDLWNHPAVSEIKKSYAKELDRALKTVETETGLRPEQVETITFHYPKLPMGPGDEALFCLQVTTKKPYPKETLLGGFRPKGEMPKGQVAKLRGDMLLHLTADNQFTVLHESLLDEFNKGKSDRTDGVLAHALKAAREGKHALVVGLDPSGLPAELFTAAPPEFQPFLPLVKSKSIVLLANLDKQLTASVRFAQESEEKAVDAERSFNLLMKLADDAITTVLNEDIKDEEMKALRPSLTELQKAVKDVKARRQGSVVTADVSLKADPTLARPIVGLFLRPQMASARARSQNNLKQIGLALHNYESVHGAFPAAAIVDKKGKPLLSWRVAILPYIEQNALYKQFKLDESWDSEHNLPLSRTVVKVFELPYGDPKPRHTNYRVFVGNGAMFDMVQGTTIGQIKDGTSNTIMVVEATESTPWAKPDEIEFDPKKPMLKHLRFEGDSVCNVLLGDGSVRALSRNIREEVVRLMIQKDEGVVIPNE